LLALRGERDQVEKTEPQTSIYDEKEPESLSLLKMLSARMKRASVGALALLVEEKKN